MPEEFSRTYVHGRTVVEQCRSNCRETQGLREKRLTTARLKWQDGQPLASDFDDIYFSRDNGLEETRHVFIAANHLSERWSTLLPGASFTIGETGFGTGLNFLCAAKLWLETAPATSTLHYVSAEKFPLHKDDMVLALHSFKKGWPELEPLAAELQTKYPPAIPGFHRLWLYDNRISLTLLYGDATEQLQQLSDTDHPLFRHQQKPFVDAWFLDGFAPAKNPDLWTPALFQQIVTLSKPQASFATFTAAGDVRRGLAEAGFKVDKVPGFGHKRDMLSGQLQERKSPSFAADAFEAQARNAEYQPPWYLPSVATPQAHKVTSTNQRIAIIGGGIAGCTLAAALAQRGMLVTLLERHNRPAAEASGNPQAVIYPKLSPQESPLSRFNLAALLFASRYYGQYSQKSSQCGVLVLPETPQEREQFTQIATLYQHNSDLVHPVSTNQMENISGLPLNSDYGLFFPQLGWIDPAAVCQQLLNHPNIQRQQCEIDRLAFDDNQWRLVTGETTVFSTPLLVLAAGYQSKAFVQTEHLPLKTLRGQISVASATETSKKLKTVICGAGYIAPAYNGKHTLGASYNPGETSLTVNEQDHRDNIERLAQTDGFFANEQPTITDGRAALRCTSPDYLPLAGPAPIAEQFIRDYVLLRKNARSHIPTAGSYWPGLYLSCGYGSRGMSYAPLAAEMLADQIAGLPPSLPLDLRIALNPARFLIRSLKRNQVD